MRLNWQAWLYGLVSGFIGGGAGAISTGVSQAITDPAHSEVHHLFVLMGVSFLITGTICAAAYLAKSPLPQIESVAVTTTTAPSNSTQTTTTVVNAPAPKP